MVARDGVIVWVWVFTLGIWGGTLEGCVVGAGSAWCWHSFATAWVIGGSLLLLVTEPDGPATCGLPVTLQILASWMGVHMFRVKGYIEMSE